LCEDEIPDNAMGPHHKDAVLIFHDEYIFIQMLIKGRCGGKGKQPIKPKGAGRGIMVSDFVDEYNGLLGLTNEELLTGKTFQIKTDNLCIA